MKMPPLYTAFCVLVLGSFVYLKYQGQEVFGATNPARGAGGPHTSGVYVGSHK
jgi:hypothetical protein